MAQACCGEPGLYPYLQTALGHDQSFLQWLSWDLQWLQAAAVSNSEVWFIPFPNLGSKHSDLAYPGAHFGMCSAQTPGTWSTSSQGSTGSCWLLWAGVTGSQQILSRWLCSRGGAAGKEGLL